MVQKLVELWINDTRLCEMNSEDSLPETVDQLMAASLVQQAEIEILLSLCRSLADRLGIAQIDGLSIEDWFQREKQQKVDEILLQFENKNPVVAAYLQNIIDQSRKRIGDLPPDFPTESA